MAAAYATTEAMREKLGASRLDNFLPRSVPQAGFKNFLDQQLAMGAGEIDSAAAAGGYATPIDVTAVAAADADTGARLAALLEHRNIQAALKGLAPAADNFPPAWTDMMAEFEVWLKDLRSPSGIDLDGLPTYEVSLPGLTRGLA